MGTVSWLHLSDWHHQTISFDQRLMRDKLIEDIEKRTTIGDGLENIDFILFSGDISFSGAKSEFKEVKAELSDPVREAVGKNVPIFCVPGNHDIERSRIIDISPDLRNKIAQLSTTRAWQQFNDVVTLPGTASELNKPLSNYFDFLEALNCKSDRSKLYNVRTIKRGGIKIGLIGINTAWNSARFKLELMDSANFFTMGLRPIANY
jgi:predicted MPP superfamily phosphohydrolase